MELIEFAHRYGPIGVDYQGAALEPLAGDAGFRRYYRLNSKPTLMLVDSPPDKERNLEYVRINDYLNRHQVRVPHMHAVSFEQGKFLLEDLGEQLLQDDLTASNAHQRYSMALDLLHRMQLADERPNWLHDYSAEYLLEEMQLFQEWFVQKLLGVTPDEQAKKIILAAFELLIDSAIKQPQAFVHRDFHCRNLMVLPDKTLATIDFQDAVWGPVTYDLVSLCRDCYVRWPQARVEETVNEHARRLQQDGILSDQAYRDFGRSFDLMGLQRHIKVLGIFARLSLRDDKPRYLNDLPLVLRYTMEVTANYPELQEFYDWMNTVLIPKVAEQDWYQDWRSAGKLLDF